MTTFYLKENDTSPALQATLRDGNREAINLTGASVSFHMRDRATRTVKVDAAGTIVSALDGIVSYAWVAADTDTPGRFEAEFEVTYSDGTIETFPNTDYITVVIKGEIA